MFTTEYFTVIINKTKFEFQLSFNKHQFSVYCENDLYFGAVCNGHLNYNERGIIMYDLPTEFFFFKQVIEKNIIKILKKNKITK